MERDFYEKYLNIGILVILLEGIMRGLLAILRMAMLFMAVLMLR